MNFNFQHAMRVLRNGILHVLEISEKRTKAPPPYLQYLSIIVSCMQMLSFLTADLQSSPWPPSLSPIEFVSSMTNLRGYKVRATPLPVGRPRRAALLLTPPPHAPKHPSPRPCSASWTPSTSRLPCGWAWSGWAPFSCC